MPTNYPTSLDNGTSIPSPTGVNTQNNPDHAALHSSTGDGLKAVETKLGIGASTPTANTFLFGTGTGTSAWTQLTSAQLAATLSDETGTGSAVFATTPTLVTPKVDTINEATGGNGTTVGGVNIKSGALNTSNSIPTAALQDSSITTAKLATGIQSSTKEQVPYKFSVYRNAAANSGAAAFALLTFDTKLFDTGTNYSTSTGLFTAPIAGFYQFSWQVGTTGTPTRIIASLAKNSTTVEVNRGSDVTSSANVMASSGSALVQLAINDTANILCFGSSAVALAIGASSQCYFTGFLVSAT